MSSQRALRELTTRPIRCHACQKYLIEYGFVHQNCQHIVCSRCSYGNKTQLYCGACRGGMMQADAPVFLQATKNGHCKQLTEIIQLSYGTHVIDKAREHLASTAPGPYAESVVQSSTIVSATTFEPTYSPPTDPNKKRSWCSCFCCCCIWEPLGRLAKRIAKYVLIPFIVLCWILWLGNGMVTGQWDMRNLPFFRDLPYVDNNNKDQTPVPPFDTYLKEKPKPPFFGSPPPLRYQHNNPPHANNNERREL